MLATNNTERDRRLENKKEGSRNRGGQKQNSW